ncbi:Conserved_hypothetical protein [Hexamita inflata]|uniref:Uncharacterized protein n=1 Tax=Hexamita inflata TaxID=28002 RepID=A0AA86N5V3_9EUKA|nr:Conserved hypothetical protein [Hexamita inflata]
MRQQQQIYRTDTQEQIDLSVDHITEVQNTQSKQIPVFPSNQVIKTISNFIDNTKSEVFQQTVTTQKQLTNFNQACEQININISTLKQDAYQIIDSAILQYMAAAEYHVQGTKMGEYRQQLVYSKIQEYFISQQKQITDDEHQLILKLIEQIFTNNKKKLLNIAEQIFSDTKGCISLFSGCMQ